MKRPRNGLPLGGALAAFLLGTQPGCLTCLHPVTPPAKEQVCLCGELPRCCRNHVYVFFVNGLDPLDCANLNGVRDYVQGLGFIKTYYGQLYHKSYFASEIRRLHQEDPDARFVLVGFSFGANQVRDLAHAVRPDGVTIDLLVYLGGNTLENTPEDRPENALRTLNVLASGCVWNGDTLDGAENVHYADVWHFGSPTHPHTLDLLAEELAVVAGRVPVVLPAELPPLEGEQAPTPRPVTVRPEGPPDEWDFLKTKQFTAEHAESAETKH
jgi:hypothetical protein